MPAEFISSTNSGPSTGVRYSGFDPDYARHVLPLVRQELLHHEATGTAPILNPDSAPELAARTP